MSWALLFKERKVIAIIIAALLICIAQIVFGVHERGIGKTKCESAQQTAVNQALTEQAKDFETQLKNRSVLEQKSVWSLQSVIDARDVTIKELQSLPPQTLVKTVTVHDQACPVVSLDPSFRVRFNAGAGGS